MTRVDRFLKTSVVLDFKNSLYSKKDKIPFCVWACCSWVYKMFIKCSISCWYGFWLFVHHCFASKTTCCRARRVQKFINSLRARIDNGVHHQNWTMTLSKNVSMLWKLSLSFSLLLHFEFLAENRRYLPSHERPRYARVGQRAFLAWWAVNFSTGSLKQ